MTEPPDHAVFASHLHATFALQLADGVPDGAPVDAQLIEVTALAARPPGGELRAAPFTLLFRVSVDSDLPQGTYRLTHGQLGALELFLVPVGRDADGLQMEAVFN